jgi:hypothetical protein
MKDHEQPLTDDERLAAEKFLKALKVRFPDLADKAYYRRGPEETVYVCFDLPKAQEAQAVDRVRKALRRLRAQLLIKHNALILVMPKLPFERPSATTIQRKRKGVKDNEPIGKPVRRSRSSGAANRRT